jgi:hypothetical protein
MKTTIALILTFVTFTASAAPTVIGQRLKLQTIDFQCQQQCMNQGMSYPYCTKVCSY